MDYKNYLKKLKECPFCKLKKSEIILKNKTAMLVLAKAPYVKNHLLVIPKKHRVNFNSLNNQEKKDLFKLINIGFDELKKYSKNCLSVLYREGNKKDSGKSISHMHVHLIPKMRIGSKDIDSDDRKVYSNKDYIEEVKKLKKIIK